MHVWFHIFFGNYILAIIFTTLNLILTFTHDERRIKNDPNRSRAIELALRISERHRAEQRGRGGQQEQNKNQDTKSVSSTRNR